MANRKLLFIAVAPLLLLLGMMLSFRILSHLPASESEPVGVPRTDFVPPPKTNPADSVTQQALESAVQGQLTAIRKGDYTAALTFSTPAFRASWNPKRFQEMIENGYKEMTESGKAEFDIGQVAEDSANLRVVVTTNDRMRMGYIYYLTREGDQWYVQTCSSGFPMGSISQSLEQHVAPQRKPQSGPPMSPQL